MRAHTQSDSKSESLRQTATLNPYPERVSAALFQAHPFFDPRDLLQVKYEMLRRVIKDGQPVGIVSTAFGFSRMSFSNLRNQFNADGLVGLLPQKKGPGRSHKLSAEVLTFIEDTLQAEPELRTRDLPGCVKERFGITIHLRSIQRALVGQRKKEPSDVHPHKPNHSQLCDLRLSVDFDMKSCVARRWERANFPVLRL